MLEILAQATSSSALPVIAVGGGTLTLGGIAVWVLRRRVEKIDAHVDDASIHVNPNNGYVTRGQCLERRVADEKLSQTRHEEIIRWLQSLTDEIREMRDDGE